MSNSMSRERARSRPAGGYTDVWTRDEDLESLQQSSKGTGRRFLRDELEYISYPDHAEARIAELTARLSRSQWPAPLRRAVRTVAPAGTRRGTAITSLARKLVR
jgi:hypothetical protein